MFETGSLGVRVALVDRYILERKSVPVEVNIYGKKFRPHVKIAEGRKKAVVVKAEYEDAKRISEETKLPFREVVRLIEESWRKKHHL
jgi:hypothetical protein